ncbi:MAG: nucleotide exchange factor GrpE [Alphaproteobacteria bacterium]|nr:nucleotide exchange factor GrpE [Alphaproteobacteria bacterium]
MNKPQNQQETPQTAKDASAELPDDVPLDLNDYAASAEIAREAAQIAGLHEQVADLKDRYLRAVAETENVRRRAEKEKSDAAQFAITRFAREMLNIVDNFARATDALKSDVRAALPASALPIIEGVEATQRELLAILDRHGIKRIESKGQRFNPNVHQAIAEVPSTDVPAGHVIDEVQSGYMIGERLLRAAMVAVATQAPGATNGARSGGPSPGSTFDTSA